VAEFGRGTGKAMMKDLVPERSDRPASGMGRKLARIRPWVQAGFLGVWLVPLQRWVGGVPGCVFHCYSCPLSAFACPVGVAANQAALFPVFFEIPFLLIGVLVLAGIAVGSLICGWACPFGYLQDGLARLSRWKLPLPDWAGHMRYVVLLGLVLALPLILGAQGIPYEQQTVSICRLCPAGALEAGLPYSAQSLIRGDGWLMSALKTSILAVFIISAVLIYRPWCRIFCPLGGWLALFNRWSLFHLRFEAKGCVECNLCRSRCPAGVKVDQKVNVPGCIRCLECTTCGAIRPALSWPGRATPIPATSGPDIPTSANPPTRPDTVLHPNDP
jgi:ferredoxin-type protein NapH